MLESLLAFTSDLRATTVRRRESRWRTTCSTMHCFRFIEELAQGEKRYKSEIDAWYRERQPELEPEAQREEQADASTMPGKRWLIAGGLLVVAGLVSVVAYLAGNGRWLHKHTVTRKTNPAVLPF